MRFLRRNRRRLLRVAAVVLLSLPACHRLTFGPRPSVVVVMIDTLRADYVGAYGFAGGITDSIDSIAREGVLFRRCWASAPWTKPSIATFFTGLDPEAHRVLTERGQYHARKRSGQHQVLDVLAPELTTMAEAFQAAGYRTAAFVANPWIRPELGFGQGFDEFHGDTGSGAAPGAEAKRPGSGLLDALREYLGRRRDKAPVFLYLHFMEVHGPYDAPDEDYQAVLPSESLGPSEILPLIRFKTMPPYLQAVPWADDPEAQDLRTWRAHYGAGARQVDDYIGELKRQLQAVGIFDDAIVIVTSDHGEQLYDHQGWDHGYSLFEDQLHVPLIVRLPQARYAGKQVESPVGLVDVLPTLLSLVGLEVPERLQGRDVTATFAGNAVPDPTEILYATAVKWNPNAASVRDRRYKLIRTRPAVSDQLFDLDVDPGERNDIAASHPQIVARLSAGLDARRKLHGQVTKTPVTVEASPLPGDVRERLRALGYLDQEK